MKTVPPEGAALTLDFIEKMKADQEQTFKSLAAGKCGCHKCIRERNELALHMVVCKTCGNKRCPHASDHEFKCTGSNDTGQVGSIYCK